MKFPLMMTAALALLPATVLAAGPQKAQATQSDAKQSAATPADAKPADAKPADATQADAMQADTGKAMAGHTMVKASATQWGDAPPVLPSGAQAAVLSGDPGKAGAFTIRLKMPAGYRIGRHWHPTDEAVTLIEGDLTLSMGEAASAHSETFAAGDFVNLPAHMQHEASSQGGAVVQVQSTGPFQITYVDAKDDPRAAGAPKAKAPTGKDR